MPAVALSIRGDCCANLPEIDESDKEQKGAQHGHLVQCQGYIFILTAGNLTRLLNDRHAAAHATIELDHFKSNVAATDYSQVLWQITSCEPVFRMDEVKVSQTVNRWNETAGSGVEHHLLCRYNLIIDAYAKSPGILAFNLCMTTQQFRII